MSTFNGIVDEFPEIRIDHFRIIQGRTPPLACFLSHVHSDHLQGLESLKAPFVYCSPATRELLLRLEKYPHRINLAKGILESRKQHYKHLRTLLKPIPLNTPSNIELTPGRSIRVTLLDANHCVGAVMFLIEDEERAILYTGDIRAEPWWVEALARNPVMIPYSYGHRRLDKIYLDTTYAAQKNLYQAFPTKAAGLSELLEKVSMYAKDTLFHFNAWTFGYEEVHVDEYKFRLYSSLANGSTPDVSTLCGFAFGNGTQNGCLTREENVRIHSCERGTLCKAVETAKNIVWITPIVCRLEEGVALPEFQVNGKSRDLAQLHELDPFDVRAANGLIAMCAKEACDVETRSKVTDLISKMHDSRDKALPLNDLNLHLKDESIPLPRFASLLKDIIVHQERHPAAHDTRDTPLEQNIQFPYARHSSYSELCHLVPTFKPSDIYPCTFDENGEQERSIETLFGHLCRGTVFCYDEQMQARRRADADTPLAAEAETEHLGSPSPCRATESTDPPEGTFPTAAAAVADPSSAVQAPLSNHARSENALKRSRVGVTARRNLDVARSFSAWTKDDYSTRKKRTRREDHED